MDRRHLLGLGLAFSAFFAWGLLAPVGKILLETFPAMTLNAFRMLFATAFLAVLVPPRLWKEGLAYLKRKDILILSVIGGGIAFTLYIYAVDLVDATYAVLGFYTAPIWTAVLARWRLGEVIGWAFLPAIALLFAGSWMALFGLDGTPQGDFSAFGMAVAVASGLGWAVYAVGLRAVAPDLRLRALMVASFLVGTAYFVVLALIVDGPPDLPAVPASAWGWMVLHAAVPTTLSLWLFNASLQRAPANQVNILVAVELAATVLFAWLLLGDTFSGVQLAGLGIAMLAVSGYLYLRGRAMRAARSVAGAPVHESRRP